VTAYIHTGQTMSSVRYLFTRRSGQYSGNRPLSVHIN